MTDKERLERIKQDDLLRIINDISLYGTGEIRMELVIEDIEWLIQQAEKIELLNAEIETLQAKWEAQGLMIQKLHRENQRYKQALEEISNADWNSEGLDAERELDKVTDLAIKALEGEE